MFEFHETFGYYAIPVVHQTFDNNNQAVSYNRSKLNPIASSFLISHLAILNAPPIHPQCRPRKSKLILPNAHKDKITDYFSMLRNPQDRQVGCFTKDTIP